jgi:hypothetical protein
LPRHSATIEPEGAIDPDSDEPLPAVVPGVEPVVTDPLPDDAEGAFALRAAPDEPVDGDAAVPPVTGETERPDVVAEPEVAPMDEALAVLAEEPLAAVKDPIGLEDIGLVAPPPRSRSNDFSCTVSRRDRVALRHRWLLNGRRSAPFLIPPAATGQAASRAASSAAASTS